MKSKTKKVLSIVLLSTLVTLGIAYVVLYCVFPTKTQTITWDIVDYICNKPLPVIGVTTLVLFICIFKLIKFIVSNRGRKLSELHDEILELKEELEESKKESEKLKELMAQADIFVNGELEKIRKLNKELCNSIPNKKVKLLGDKFYGKEEVNSETKAD